jgi:hypothetical protein
MPDAEQAPKSVPIRLSSDQVVRIDHLRGLVRGPNPSRESYARWLIDKALATEERAQGVKR